MSQTNAGGPLLWAAVGFLAGGLGGWWLLVGRRNRGGTSLREQRGQRGWPTAVALARAEITASGPTKFHRFSSGENQ